MTTTYCSNLQSVAHAYLKLLESSGVYMGLRKLGKVVKHQAIDKRACFECCWIRRVMLYAEPAIYWRLDRYQPRPYRINRPEEPVGGDYDKVCI